MDIDDSKYGVNEKSSRVSQNSMEIARDKECRKKPFKENCSSEQLNQHFEPVHNSKVFPFCSCHKIMALKVQFLSSVRRLPTHNLGIF